MFNYSTIAMIRTVSQSEEWAAYKVSEWRRTSSRVWRTETSGDRQRRVWTRDGNESSAGNEVLDWGQRPLASWTAERLRERDVMETRRLSRTEDFRGTGRLQRDRRTPRNRETSGNRRSVGEQRDFQRTEKLLRDREKVEEQRDRDVRLLRDRETETIEE